MSDGEEAFSAVRLCGFWMLQTPYGRSCREATEEEVKLLDATWDGGTDGCGNDYHSLVNSEEEDTDPWDEFYTELQAKDAP